MCRVSGRVTKTSVRYRKISNSQKHPVSLVFVTWVGTLSLLSGPVLVPCQLKRSELLPQFVWWVPCLLGSFGWLVLLGLNICRLVCMVGSEGAAHIDAFCTGIVRACWPNKLLLANPKLCLACWMLLMVVILVCMSFGAGSGRCVGIWATNKGGHESCLITPCE